MLKYKYIFQRKHTEAILSNSTLKPLQFEITKMLIPVLKKGKGRPYSITERNVPELIPVFDSQSAGDVSHKPGGRLPLLFARPAVILATLNRADTDFAAS